VWYNTGMRTDIHRVSQIVPGDYDSVFSFAAPSMDDIAGFNWALLRASLKNEEVEEPICQVDHLGFAIVKGYRKVQPMAQIAGRFFSQNPTQCDVCGVHFKYGDVWQHRATGEVITIGHDCAEKFGLLTDRADLDRYRDELCEVRALGRARHDRKKALREFVKGSSKELRVALRCKHAITLDIRGKLIRNAAKFGANLTEKQQALVLKLAAQEAEKATRPVEVNVPAPVVEGKRVTIIGDVVSIKTYESDFGSSEKITVKVKTEAGVWLAWGTAPSSLLCDCSEIGGIKGCRVQFDAVLKAGREPHFALFSRPTKAKVLAAGNSARTLLEKLKGDLAHAEATTGFAQSGEWFERTRKTVARLEGLL